MKVAIYARVSTDQQTEENQLAVLEKWAADRGWPIAGVYRDVGSAWQSKGDRVDLARLMADCHKGLVNLVLVYDLSRLTRKGPAEMFLTLKRFADNGAQVYSYMEPEINVPNDFAPVLIALYSVIANIYSKQLSARTKAGMARAKANGVHCGRPHKERVKIGPDDLKSKRKLESLKKRMAFLQKQVAEIIEEKGVDNLGGQPSTPFESEMEHAGKLGH
jgi:putative DNA-invertase from lambdoid prophage Rac